jgi:DNA-binding SARP family transcriptional activator
VAGRIDVCLLGDVLVRNAGEPVAISGAKLKAIVAMLALGSPHPVSHERLIDEIWADDPIANPANALQAQISALRRLLGRDAVERRGPGYVLAVSPDDVDTIRLERLVRAGRDAAAAGDHHAAARHHQAALALVRGPALDGISQYGFARDAAIWLDELVLSAQEELMDALLATGAHAEVVTTLSGLVRNNPLREHLQAQLILALYRSGRQADALRAYQDARTALLDELGIDPGAELQALEQAVLAHDPSLDLAAAPAPAAPVTAPQTVPLLSDRPKLAGRDEELAALRADLSSAVSGRGRIGILGGEPGIGKTRLVEEMSDRAETEGAVVVWGRCFEGRGAPSFWPWTQIIQGLLSHFDDDVLRIALGSGVAEVAVIVPEVKELVPDHEPPPPVDPESAKFRLCQAVFDFVNRLTRERPILIVVDDLHWADPSSLDLISFIASEMFDSRLLLLGTYRNIDPALGGALADTLVDLGRRSVVRRIELEGLDHAGIEELLTAAGADSDPALLASA